jgi:energy-coupling factor transporter ATP-binding protein EcfA2
MSNSIKANRTLGDKKKVLEIVNPARITILFGKNGVGKSTFLRDLYQNNPNDFHLLVPERGGEDLAYRSNLFDQESREPNRKNVRSKNGDNQYRERAISRTVAITQSIGYKQLKKQDLDDVDAEGIENLFGLFLPEFRAEFSDVQPYNIQFFREDGGAKIGSTTELSSGQAEALSIASDIVTQAVLWQGSKKYILVDEPDAHLHLDLQNRFAIFIEEVSLAFKVNFIITTHSQALVAGLMNICGDVGVVCLDTKKEKISPIYKDSNFIFSSLLSSDLALARILNKKIVIVEGNDDYLVWNQASRSHNFEDIVIIEAGGGDILEYKKNAEKILSATDDSLNQIGITLTDRDDKGDATHDVGSLLPVKRLSCRSLENLFFTEEILGSIKKDINLPKLLEEFKKTNSNYNAEVSLILKNKKNAKISKGLVKAFHSYIDNHASSTDWRIRVGKVLGAEKPQGELLDFLSEDVVNYVWGTI